MHSESIGKSKLHTPHPSHTLGVWAGAMVTAPVVEPNNTQTTEMTPPMKVWSSMLIPASRLKTTDQARQTLTTNPLSELLCGIYESILNREVFPYYGVPLNFFPALCGVFT